MTRTTYKRVPFNLALAKKIMSKEVKGRIVTRSGWKARIICFDRKERKDIFEPPRNIIALIDNKGGDEEVHSFRDTGMIFLLEESDFDLLIEVPTYYRDYSNFMPQKLQACIVRDFNYEVWVIRVCCGKDSDGGPTFFNTPSYHYWNYILPLNNVTERLVGTIKSYEQLIQELDAESTATTKNEQQ